MDIIRLLIDQVSTNLAIAAEKIVIDNSANKQDINVFLETVYLKIYNTIYETNLENTNLLNSNYPGIDGIDHEKNIIVQISSTITNDKIEKTIKTLLSQDQDFSKHNLIFIFLKKKKKYSDSFREKIKRIVTGKIQFDLSTNIIDYTDFYNRLLTEQNLDKITTVNKILDESLGFMPENKVIGVNSIGISFDQEEINNAYRLIDILIREGINVIIRSKELYQLFVKNEHRFLNFLILINNPKNLEFVKKTILVLSNKHINNIFSENSSKKCFIYEYGEKNDIKFQVVTFDKYLNSINIPNLSFRSYIFLNQENIRYKLNSVIENFITESRNLSYNIENIKQELCKIFSNFEFNEEFIESEFHLLNFNMHGQKDLVLNFLILNKEYSLISTKQIYLSKYSRKFSKNLQILVPKKIGQKTNNRILNVKAVFGKHQVTYIDEYLYDYKFKQVDRQRLLKIDDFVSPVIKDEVGVSQLSDIIHWIIDDSKSTIAVIKAAGGVGKTTICEKIHDKLITEYDRYNVIFIDAKTYINKFKNRNFIDDTEYDLYNIFKECHPHSNIIDKNSFYLNYSLGNIIIIFDGIDEIISTIPLFNIRLFLSKLEKLKDVIGKGKILVNCRDTYIDELKDFYLRTDTPSISSIVFYELLSFNKALAAEYFSKHLDESKVQVGIQLLDDFNLAKEIQFDGYIYPPFILEIVVLIIEEDFVYEQLDPGFYSEVLLKNVDLDFIIYRVCSREISKKKEFGFVISVDEQVKFMSFIAIEEKGQVNKNQFIKVLKDIGLTDRLEQISKGLFDHPFLYKSHGNYKFRFEFLKSHFKSITLFNIMLKPDEHVITDKVLDLIATDFSYDSYVFKAISERLHRSNENFDFFMSNCKQLLNKLRSNENHNINNIKRAISNLTLFFISFEKNYNLEVNVLKTLFGDGNDGISGLCLIDVPDKINLELDFSDCWFFNAHIDNFKNFFKCKFSDNTFFDGSSFIAKVYNQELDYENLSISSTNFDSVIKGDNSAYRLLKLYEESGGSIKMYFESFFKLFESNNKIVDSINKSNVYNIKGKHRLIQLLINSLKENNIVEKETEFELFINKKLKARISKFIKQDMPFKELNNAQKSLEKNLAEEKSAI